MPRHGRRWSWLICWLIAVSTAWAQDPRGGSRSRASEDPRLFHTNDDAPSPFHQINPERQPAPWEDDVQFHDVQFVTSRLGFAVGDLGTIWRTSDSGDSWELIRTDLPCPLRSVCFLTDKLGWVAGGGIHPYTHVPYGVVLATEDGGLSWKNLASLPVSVGPQQQKRRVTAAATVLDGLHSERSGGDPEVDNILSNLENGLGADTNAPGEPALLAQNPRFGSAAKQTEKPFLPNLTAVRFFDRRHGVISGTPTADCPSGILLTDDGGQTFRSLPAKVSGQWRAISFAHPGQGIVVGLRGTSALLSQGQLQATKLNNLDPRGLFGVKLQLNGPGWLVGDGGLVLQTNDQGVVWNASPGDMPEGVNRIFDFRAVAARGKNVWVAGEPGTVVWRSADAGKTWKRGITRQTLPIRALSFVDDLHGWAVGALGTILRTEDGGESWRQCRAGQRRLALMSMTAHAHHTPLSLLTHASAEFGYRTAVLQVARDDAGPAAVLNNGRQDLLDLAVTFAGGNTSRTSWQFPLSVPGLDRDSNRLLADWNRRTENRLTETLIGHLVTQLRTWRPSVIVLEESVGDDALARTIQQAALHAVTQAADGQYFPQHLQVGGLATWQVGKIFTRLPPTSKGPISLDQHLYLPRMGASVQVVAAPARALLGSRLAPATETFRLRKSYVPNLREDLAGVDFFSGLGISPGTTARREMLPQKEEDIERQLEIARRQRNVNASLNQFMRDDRFSNQIVAQLDTVIRDMPPAQAALQLQQTAEAYLASGRIGLAEQTLIKLVERFPDEPAAAQSMVWLIQYWGSQETTWQRVRNEAIGKQQSSPNPEAITHRMTKAHNRLRRQFEDEQRRNSILPVAASDETPPADPDEFTPADFNHNRRNGHLDPEVQFKEWQRRSREMSQQLETRIPGIYREPQVQFPLASLARKQGNPLRSDEIFRRFLPAEGIEASGLVPREIWLTNTVSPPSQPPAICIVTSERPVLDGVLSDPCWQRAAEVVLSTAPTGAAKGEKHPFVMFCYDSKYLYLAGSFPRSPGTRTDGPIGRARQHDEDLRDFDRLQILLDVDRDYFTWYEFQIDQRGCTSDACWRDKTWNPKWFVATQSDEQTWRIEIAIPFSELAWKAPGSERPGAGVPAQVWGLSVIRTIPAIAVESWIHPTQSTPTAESFGLLRFE